MKTIRVLPFQPDTVKESNADGCNDNNNIGFTPMSSSVSLDIGGTVFRVDQNNLRRYPNTFLGKLNNEHQSYDCETDRFYFDRNAIVFHFILDFYRHGRLHFPHDFCGLMIKDELAFWEIPEDCIAKCCWNHYVASEENLRVLSHLEKLFDRDATTSASRRDSVVKNFSLRRRIWLFMEDPRSSKGALIWSYVLMCVILLAVLSFSLETLSIFRQPIGNVSAVHHDDHSSSQLEYFEKTEPKLPMKCIEIFTGIFFIVEITVRIVSCPDKFVFFKSVINWVDMICISGMIAHYVIGLFKEWFPESSQELALVSRYLWLGRVLRVLRVFKLSRSHDGFRVLLLGVQASFREIMLVALVLIITILFYAPLIFLAEFSTLDFPNIPTGWWWALITMTTVGYGDIYPSTVFGYVVGSFCAMSGLIVLGLTVPIIANNFNVYYKYLQHRKSREARQKENFK